MRTVATAMFGAGAPLFTYLLIYFGSYYRLYCCVNCSQAHRFSNFLFSFLTVHFSLTVDGARFLFYCGGIFFNFMFGWLGS